MKKPAILFASIFFIVNLYSLPPRTPAHDFPGKKEVILVGKIAFTDSINRPIEGLQKLFYPNSTVDDFNYIYFVLDDGMTDSIWGSYAMNFAYKNWDFNQTFFFDNKPSKDGYINVAEIHVSLFANRTMEKFFRIPLNINVKCPPDSKFVYVGTFELDVDYAFRVKKVNYIDDFESAQEEVQKYYGESTKLVRGDVKYRIQ